MCFYKFDNTHDYKKYPKVFDMKVFLYEENEKKNLLREKKL
jgi:hypothetical protein